jgi:hypothetical protein
MIDYELRVNSSSHSEKCRLTHLIRSMCASDRARALEKIQCLSIIKDGNKEMKNYITERLQK